MTLAHAAEGRTRNALRKTSAPYLLSERARITPHTTALYVRRGGIQATRTWLAYAENVARAARAFAKLGVKAGDRVVILADVCEEWAVCDLAAQSIGAIVCGVYPTSAASEVASLVRRCAPVLAVAGNAAQAEKIRVALDAAACEAEIVVVTAGPADARPISYHALIEDTELDLAWWEARVRVLSPESPAFIVFTSGTTGEPRGALVAHGKHLAAASTLVEHYPMLAAGLKTTVVYLPPCHVLGRNVAITLPLISNLVPCFGDPREALPATLAAVRPHVLFLVPRLLQKFAALAIMNAQSLGIAKRLAYRASLLVARGKRSRPPALVRPLIDALYVVARYFVFLPILRRLGFDRLELVLSGGAPVPTAAITLWHWYGVNVVQGYGTTETAGALIAAQRGPFPRPGSVGVPASGTKVRLGVDGEILVHDPDLFDRYWGDQQSTNAAHTDEGWLRTGDIGKWDRDELYLIDRARDFIVTAGGKTISPSFIENVLRASPFVAEAIVFGHGRKYLTALIELDFDAAALWARLNGLRCELPGLANESRIEALVRREVAKANDNLARVEQIKDLRILPRPLQPGLEDEPITATRKVKRAAMYARFSDLVEAMYDDSEERLIADTIKGGRKAGSVPA